MHILIGYGHAPYTTGRYFEAALAHIGHRVTFVGSAGGERPGYPADVDLLEVIDHLPERADLFLYIDSGHRSYLPFNLHRLPCPTAAYMIDVHIGSKLRLPLAEFFDYVFVAQKRESEAYRRFNRQHVAWLPLACDREMTQPPVEGRPPQYDIGFVGNVPPGSERERLLDLLGSRFTLNDYRRGYAAEEIGLVYAGARIVFNHSLLNDINMRVFEGLASGRLLVTQHLDNGLDELFIPDRHLVTYQSDRELLEKVAYFLGHEGEREAIAASGLAAVSSGHTYDHRCKAILEAVFDRAPGCRAPVRGAAEGDVLRHYTRVYSMLRLVDPCLAVWRLNLSLSLRALPDGVQVALGLARRVKHG